MLNSTLHPSIWKFINVLQRKEQVNPMKIKQFIAGIEPPTKKIYKDRSFNLIKICLDYINRPIDDYFRGIAHNFQLKA